MVAPSMFIGSSRESNRIARAIKAELEPDVEGTVWTQGAFELGSNHLADLAGKARASDFALFVFAPDDTASIQEKPTTITRDNVVFELGLFCGAIGENRCFFVTPSRANIRIPTDLAGISYGTYDERRTDGNWRAAVATFCDHVRQRVEALGPREWQDYPRLRELALQYEFCDRIADEDNRIKEKDSTYDDMRDFCGRHDINKARLLREPRLGFYVALAAAIRENPKAGDADILQQIVPAQVRLPNACYKMLYAVSALARLGELSKTAHTELLDWADRLPCENAPFRLELAALRQ